MKSVLISIQWRRCDLIAIGKKTIEVRKTRPKIETPFKCYIYCIKNRKDYLHMYINSGYARNFRVTGRWDSEEDIIEINSHLPAAYRSNAYLAEGKVIGEFVCDKVVDMRDINLEPTRLTIDEWLKYTDKHKGVVWGWHISDLIIYDKPKELSEFFTPMGKRPSYMIERPPHSWCYVEELEVEK